MSNFIAAAVIFMVISPCVIVAQEPPSKTMSDEEMEEKGRQEQARFELFNECRPVWLSVTGINLNGEEEELTDSTERALQNAIEIRHDFPPPLTTGHSLSTAALRSINAFTKRCACFR